MTSTPAPRFCECGCGEPVARRFRPGHDAKLKGALLAATHSTVWQQREAAVLALIERGWGNWVDIEVLACTPKRGRSSDGRRVQSLNINGLAAVHADPTGTGHAHRFCPEIQGETRMVGTDEAGACSACIHLTELVEDVMMAEWRKQAAA